MRGVYHDDLFWGMCPALAINGGRPWPVHRDRIRVLTDRILEVAPLPVTTAPSEAGTEAAAPSDTSWHVHSSAGITAPSECESEFGEQDLDGASDMQTQTAGALEVPTSKAEKTAPSEAGTETTAPSDASLHVPSSLTSSAGDSSWQDLDGATQHQATHESSAGDDSWQDPDGASDMQIILEEF